MTKTIVCRVSDYPPHSGLNGYRFIREYRHWIVALMHYVGIGVRQPDWQIRDEVYTLGFIQPNYPVPAIKRGQWYADYYYLGYVTAENGWPVEDIYSKLGII